MALRSLYASASNGKRFTRFILLQRQYRSLAGGQVKDVRPAMLVDEEVDPFGKLRTGLVVRPPRERPIAWKRSPLFVHSKRSGAP
jgi:hypothetical protein